MDGLYTSRYLIRFEIPFLKTLSILTNMIMSFIILIYSFVQATNIYKIKTRKQIPLGQEALYSSTRTVYRNMSTVQYSNNKVIFQAPEHMTPSESVSSLFVLPQQNL